MVCEGEMVGESLALDDDFPDLDLLGVVVLARLLQPMLDSADLPALSYRQTGY